MVDHNYLGKEQTGEDPFDLHFESFCSMVDQLGSDQLPVNDANYLRRGYCYNITLFKIKSTCYFNKSSIILKRLKRRGAQRIFIFKKSIPILKVTTKNNLKKKMNP